MVIEERESERSDHRWLAWLAFSIGVVKALELLIDPRPHVFLGDSASYLWTAVSGWVPPDRSFVYGWAIGGLCKPFHSLLPLFCVQSAMGAASGLILTYLLRRHFGCRRWIAGAAAFIFALDPLQAHYEHTILTEAPALFFLVLGLWALIAFSASRRFWVLLLAAFDFALLVLIRQAFMLVAIGLLICVPPIVAIWKGAGMRRFKLAAASVPALLVYGGLIAGYVSGLAAWKKVPPQLSRSDGFFLVSYYAPLLQPADIDDPEVRGLVSAQGKYPLEVRGILGYSSQMFWDGGLVDRLRKRYGDLAANSLARNLAISAAKKHPLHLAKLSLETFLDYWRPSTLRWSAHTGLGLDFDASKEFVDSLRTVFNSDLPPNFPRRGSFFTHVLEVGWAMTYPRLAFALCLALAGVYAVFRGDLPLAIVGLAFAFIFLSLCLLTVMDVRYLHSASWFGALAACVAGERLLEQRKA